MNKYGISEAKSTVGFKTYAVPNRALGESKTLRGLLLRSAVFVSAFSMVFSVFTPMNIAQANHDPFNGAIKDKVAICHSGNGKNFIVNEPSISGTGNNPSIQGHENHSSDIIPPFHYAGGVYAGKNWNAGKDIWNNGKCDGFSDDDQGNIKIVKKTIGGDGTFEFVTTGSGFSIEPLTTVGGTASVIVTQLPKNAEFSISETVPAGWDLTSAICDNDQTIAKIKVKKGKTITCTFTNTKQADPKGKLTLVKEVAGQNPPNEASEWDL